MSEDMVVLIFFTLYGYTVVWRIAYELGRTKGSDDFRDFQKTLLGVGTVWRVGDDGKLYQQKERES